MKWNGFESWGSNLSVYILRRKLDEQQQFEDTLFTTSRCSYHLFFVHSTFGSKAVILRPFAWQTSQAMKCLQTLVGWPQSPNLCICTNSSSPCMYSSFWTHLAITAPHETKFLSPIPWNKWSVSSKLLLLPYMSTRTLPVQTSISRPIFTASACMDLNTKRWEWAGQRALSC